MRSAADREAHSAGTALLAPRAVVALLGAAIAAGTPARLAGGVRAAGQPAVLPARRRAGRQPVQSSRSPRDAPILRVTPVQHERRRGQAEPTFPHGAAGRRPGSAEPAAAGTAPSTRRRRRDRSGDSMAAGAATDSRRVTRCSPPKSTSRTRGGSPAPVSRRPVRRHAGVCSAWWASTRRITSSLRGVQIDLGLDNWACPRTELHVGQRQRAGLRPSDTPRYAAASATWPGAGPAVDPLEHAMRRVIGQRPRRDRRTSTTTAAAARSGISPSIST